MIALVLAVLPSASEFPTSRFAAAAADAADAADAAESATYADVGTEQIYTNPNC